MNIITHIQCVHVKPYNSDINGNYVPIAHTTDVSLGTIEY